MEKRENKRMRLVIVGALLSVALFFLPMLAMEGEAANKYGTFKGRAPQTYEVAGDTVYFYPKKIYYSGKKVVCYVYLVNMTDKKIKGVSNVKLTLRDEKNKVVASHKFKAMKNVTVKSKKYKTVKFVFPASSVKKKKFNFGKANRMSIKASYTYYPE